MRRLTKRGKDLPQVLINTGSLLLSTCCRPSPGLGTASSHLVLLTTHELSVPVTDKETRGRRHPALHSCGWWNRSLPRSSWSSEPELVTLSDCRKLWAELDLENTSHSELSAPELASFFFFLSFFFKFLIVVKIYRNKKCTILAIFICTIRECYIHSHCCTTKLQKFLTLQNWSLVAIKELTTAPIPSILRPPHPTRPWQPPCYFLSLWIWPF